MAELHAHLPGSNGDQAVSEEGDRERAAQPGSPGLRLGLGFWVLFWSWGFKIFFWGLGFRVFFWGLGFRVFFRGLGFRVSFGV